jgi:hypothetical protein
VIRTKKFLERELERYRHEVATLKVEREKAEFMLGDLLSNVQKVIRQLERAEPLSEELLAMRTAAADLAYLCDRIDTNRYPEAGRR